VRRRIALCREIKDDRSEAIGHQELGRLLAYHGAYAESETEQATALKMFEKGSRVQGQGITWAYRALRDLLRLRSTVAARNLKHRGTERSEKTPVGSTDLLRDLCASLFPKDQAPLDSARRALELADEWARTNHPLVRDYVRAHWLLGAAHRVAGQPDEAERHLHEALQRCRRINMVDHEADILIDLVRLRAATGGADEAQRMAEEALLIADRSGYVLQGADAHLELARLALARGDQAAARQHAEESHRLATCDGPPDYTYHAAYTESAALLAQLRNPQD
jgi:tetratricopeptide (TPR) repeat protein